MMFFSGEVAIIATFAQAVVTGTYFASFLLCLRWLVFSDDGGTLCKGINWPFLIITIILFGFSVTDISISLQSTLLDFENRDGALYTVVLTRVMEMLSLIITDAVLVFRCWAVYGRSWRITVLPLLLLLYNVSSLLMMTYWNATISGDGTERLDNQLRDIQGSFFASTIGINLYATSAIIVKIWRNSFSRHLCRFTVRVVAESGLLYTLTSIVTFCTVYVHVPGGFEVATAINFPVSGIAYHLILIRVAQNRAKPEEYPMPSFIFGGSAVPTVPQGNSESVISSV